ncbi:hypothetical protein ES702_04044 [subsurface metagenome]
MTYVETSNKHIKEILRFLKNMGFKDVNGGPNFNVGNKQVDACAGHESTLLIIECTTQKDINSKTNSFRGKIHDIIDGFKSEEKYKLYRYYKPILAVKYQRVTKTNLKHAMESKGRKIYIWDNNYISYYSNLQRTIKEYAIYNLLAEIEVEPETSEQITIPVFHTRVGPQGRYILFLFFIKARDLLKFSYVARRELGYESFYQRMVKKRRLKEISEKYIQQKKMIFPNSIVVALDDDCWYFESISKKFISSTGVDLPKWLDIGKLTLKNNYRSCWIIDGQHRLYSYSHTTVPGLLVISAFAEIDPEMQANYFLDINREAKSVNPNLLWDLTGSLSPDSTKGIISKTVKALCRVKNGFFENNIKIPSMGSGNFSFNNLCVSIEKNYLAENELGRHYEKIKNPFRDNDLRKFERNLSNGINQYFTLFYEGLSEEKKNKLFSDGFVSVMIEIFKLLVIHLNKKPSEDDEKKFFSTIWEFIEHYNDEEVKKIIKLLTSEANKKDFRNDLIRILRENYDQEFAVGVVKKEPSLAEKIGDLEYKLNKFVNSVLEKKIGPGCINKYITDGTQRKECLKKSKLHNRPPWEFLNFLTTINTIILNNELWGRFFKEIFISKDYFSSKNELVVLANKLWGYRSNKTGHPKKIPIFYTRDQVRITQSAYNIFNSIIESE